MKPIGGFLELEVGPPHPSFPHRGASALTSGRACLRQALQRMRPRRAFVPFYICDAALRPFSVLGIDVRFYDVVDTLESDAAPRLEPGECILAVNYFGLNTASVARLARAHGDGAIIDDCHAFFQRGYQGSWSFNSARKFFGVPDGAFLYAPSAQVHEYPPNTDLRSDYLVSRWLGRTNRAFAEYESSERVVTSDGRGISELSRAMLEAVDHDRIREIRRRNYARLDGHLGTHNRLPARLAPDDETVPFCYPMLPSKPVVRERLLKDGLHVPVLWPEVRTRPGPGYQGARALVDRLLPLPIDQRYGDADMDRLAERLRALL